MASFNLARMIRIAALAAAAVWLVPDGAAGSVGTAITYQGTLDENGAPVDQNTDFQFTLWDAAAAGNQIGIMVAINNHPVVGGRFTVQLDFGNEFDGDARFLEIAVRSPAGVGGFTTLSPRQELTPAPYALFALNAAGASDYWMLNASNLTNSAGNFVGINRDTRVTNAEYFGVQAPVASGYGGMYIRTDGADGWPFYGYRAGLNSAWHYFDGTTAKWHLHNSGTRMTVDDAGRVGIGTTDPQYRLDVRSPSPRAIFGWTTNAIGNNYGVFGQSASDGGAGVFGNATANSGDTAGVIGQADSPSGRGVSGLALNAGGVNYGVYGETNSGAGYGGYFLNDTTGIGLFGGTASGTGVFGFAAADSGIGVRGEIPTPNGIGVLGRRVNPFGTDPAVRGETLSRGRGAVGVHGIALGTDTDGETYGVLGESVSTRGVGVRGSSDIGVQGEGKTTGVQGTATGVGGNGVRGEGTTGVRGIGEGGAGVVGEAGSAVTPGIWAIGWGTDWLDAPALRADGGSGPAIFAVGATGVRGEGTDTGVVGTGTTASSYGGFFSNLDEDGVALAVQGPTIMSANAPLPAVPVGVVLAVDGKVLAEELEVQLSEDWPDFVFADDYSLPPLAEIEAFVREHGHLPDVPSAQDVAQHGINVGAMQATLLQKVEELTLHVIEVDKKLANTQHENQELRARLASIEARQ
jgi:hypothetical protein